jgi:hypothetical protein
MLALSVGLVAGGASMSGCHKKAADASAQAPDPEPVKQSFIALQKQFSDMQKSFADLRTDLEALPSDLNGYPQLRAQFYQAEEARGVVDAKMTVLSGQLNAALQSGKAADLQQVSNSLEQTSADARQLGEIYIKLLHQVMAFQRAAESHKPAATASNGPTGAATKAAPAKRKR